MTRWVVIALMIIVAIAVICIGVFTLDLITPNGGISGKVSGANGGIAGVSAFIQPYADGVPPGIPTGNEPMVTTGADGSYSFTDTTPGKYRVTFSRLNNADGTYYESTVKEIVVAPGATATCDVTLVRRTHTY